jgi:hypothetical protein
MSEDKKPLEVISHEDGVKILGQLKELQEWKENGDESTKLELSQRADDVAKAVERVEEIQADIDAARKEFAEERRRAALESGEAPLMKALDRYKAGYRAPRGDEDEFTAETTAAPTVKQLVEGVSMAGEWYAPEHEEVAYLREQNDKAVMLDAIMRGRDPSGYQQRGGASSLKIVQECRRFAGELFEKATSGAVDTVDLANWVPAHFSSLMWDDVRLATPEASLFPEIIMPGKTMDLNVNLTDPEGQLVPEVTTIAAANPFADTLVQDLDPTKRTLSAKKFRSRIVFSGEVEEDAIVAQLPFYRAMLVEGMSNAIADAIINGDEGGTLDNTASAVDHFTKSNPAGTDTGDSRGAFDGLRAFLEDNTALPDTFVDGSGGDLSSGLIGSVWERMGEYGAGGNDQLITFTSPVGYIKLVQDNNFITKDLMGEMATLLTGAIGKVWNIPVSVSRRYPINLASGTGKIGAAADSATTGACVVRRDKCILGNRRRMTMGMDRYGATDAGDIYLFWRGDFERLLPVTKPWIGGLFNLATT